jgi:hypothetical protein
VDRVEEGGPVRAEEAFHLQLQQLENIARELGARGQLGDDPSWVQEYAYRIFEVGEALRGLAMSRTELNPSHKSYR